MANLPAVKLTGVSKRYSDVTTVDYLDLEVRRGEIIGLHLSLGDQSMKDIPQRHT
jgi:ABC-type uncharacterized transport system ATPase subunit